MKENWIEGTSESLMVNTQVSISVRSQAKFSEVNGRPDSMGVSGMQKYRMLEEWQQVRVIRIPMIGIWCVSIWGDLFGIQNNSFELHPGYIHK